MPTYVVTSILIVVLGVELGLVPTFGWKGAFSTSAIVPVFSLALAPLAAVIRYFRSSMLEVMHLDYIRTARAKGLRPILVIVRHMGRNALIPVMTVVGRLCVERADRIIFCRVYRRHSRLRSLFRARRGGARLSGHHWHDIRLRTLSSSASISSSISATSCLIHASAWSPS